MKDSNTVAGLGLHKSSIGIVIAETGEAMEVR